MSVLIWVLLFAKIIADDKSLPVKKELRIGKRKTQQSLLHLIKISHFIFCFLLFPKICYIACVNYHHCMKRAEFNKNNFIHNSSKN